MERLEATEAIKAKSWDRLLQQDQLLREKRENRVFSGWNEAPITFAPTYKYDYGTDIYDSSEKARIPAYCDRVLWQREGESNLIDPGRCVFYGRYEIKSSDHRPVVALIDINVAQADQALVDEVRVTYFAIFAITSRTLRVPMEI